MFNYVRTLVFVFALVFVSQSAMADVVANRIVANVNGEIITLFDLNKRLKPLLEQFKGRKLTDKEKEVVVRVRKDILNKMVEDILIQKQVERLGLTVSEVELTNQIEDVRKKNKLTKDEFEQQLMLEGMTLDEYREKMREDILKHRLLGAMVKRKVVVSSEEIEQYFEEHKSQFVQGRSVNLSAIIVRDLAIAENIQERIEKEELTFEDAADIHTQGPGVGQGGALGDFKWLDVSPEWRSALEGIQEGQCSAPFAFRGMYVLLKLNSSSSGDQMLLDETRDEIREIIFKEQLEMRFNEYMEQLRSEAVINVNL